VLRLLGDCRCLHVEHYRSRCHSHIHQRQVFLGSVRVSCSEAGVIDQVIQPANIQEIMEGRLKSKHGVKIGI
jgi:hypothetical protein